MVFLKWFKAPKVPEERVMGSIDNPPDDWDNLGYGTYVDRRMWHDDLRVLHFRLLVTQASRTGRGLFVEE